MNKRRAKRWLAYILDKEWDESEHPRAENGQFASGPGGGGGNGASKEDPDDIWALLGAQETGGSAAKGKTSGESPAEKIEVEPIPDDVDIWAWLEELGSGGETPEEKAAREAKEREAEEERKARETFGQNGLLEKEFPADMRLTKAERAYLDSNVAGFFDDNRRGKKTYRPLISEMYKAAIGRPLLVNLDFERRKAQEKLKEADEMIAQRVQEGYKGLSREESARKWRELQQALAGANEFERGDILGMASIGKNGIQAWQRQRAEARRTLEDCDFIEKLQRRAQFAKNKGG